MISDAEQIAEIDWLEAAEKYRVNERRWREKSDYKAAEKSQDAHGRMWKMWSEPAWADRRTMAECFNQYCLRLLYKHRAEA